MAYHKTRTINAGFMAQCMRQKLKGDCSFGIAEGVRPQVPSAQGFPYLVYGPRFAVRIPQAQSGLPA
ncbi:MAG: hypothetical protein MRK00_03655 [Nitrosomonas sp.]|nr:hypothetical protein [Nitrosomonas sp.]